MLELEKGLVRVLFVCTGLGIIPRGIEAFFREAFNGLRHVPGLRLRLAKGAGTRTRHEHTIWNLRRTGFLASLIGSVFHRDAYTVEQWTSLFSVLLQIQSFRPHVVFYSEANLGFLLHRFRRFSPVPYRLLFSNGGPVHPPFNRTDTVHQVAPCYRDEALRAGESPAKHWLVPYGIKLGPPPTPLEPTETSSLRLRLGLPTDRKILLSVGWIQRAHKRMDYLIQEISRLPLPRPFVLLLGSMDHRSSEIVRLGTRLLGQAGFSARSVPYDSVFDFYRAADCFALASLNEGFGRVYLESLMHGLPTIAHRNPVTDFVLGPWGILLDLSRPGALAKAIAHQIFIPRNPALSVARWASIRDRFSWAVLSNRYLEMFQACAFSPTA